MANKALKAPIIFTLNNTGIHHSYTAMSFTIIELLLGVPTSKMHQFIQELGFFTANDFMLLNNKIIDEKNVKVPMNQKDIIIFFAAVHFSCFAILDEEETNNLTSILPEELKNDFEDIKEKILSFGTVIGKKFREDFHKYETFLAAVKKIETM